MKPRKVWFLVFVVLCGVNASVALSSFVSWCRQNCCVMSLTLLDEFHKPFWCVSCPVRVAAARWPVTQDYGGEHFLLDYHDREGQVKLKLVWLKEQDCFLLVGLSVFLAVWKVNEHFGTNY